MSVLIQLRSIKDRRKFFTTKPLKILILINLKLSIHFHSFK